MNTYDVMDKIGQAQSVLDCALAAMGDIQIPDCDADVQGALGVASRMLREAHQDLDRLTHAQPAGRAQP